MQEHDFVSALNAYVAQIENVNRYLDQNFQASIYGSDSVICMQLSKLFLLDWNDVLNKSLGWTNKELSNIPWLDLVHPNDRLLATWVSQGEGLFYSQEKVDFFYIRYRHKNGNYRWLKFFRQAYWYKHAWYTVAEDITDIESEGEFLQTLEEVRNGRGNS